MKSRFLLAALVMTALFFSSCDNRSNIANSAASIYEAAKAIDAGVKPSLVTPSIRAQAYAIILATEHTYSQAERDYANQPKDIK